MDERFEQISEQAALNASTALSRLVGRPVVVKLSQVEVKAVGDIVWGIDGEETGVGVCLPVTGAVRGEALLFFPMDDAIGLADCLLSREAGVSEELGELELSALKEVGNIVTGAYMTVLSDVSGVRLLEQVPSVERGKFNDVLSDVLAQLSERVERAVVMSIDFLFTQPALKGYWMVLLELADLESIFGRVECT